MAWSMYINQRSISITNDQGKIIARVQVEEGGKEDNFTVANQIVNANKLLKRSQEENSRLKLEISRLAEQSALFIQLKECEQALIGMVAQYCTDGPSAVTGSTREACFSHYFMSAGENAFEYLVKNGLAKWCGNGVDIELISSDNSEPSDAE